MFCGLHKRPICNFVSVVFVFKRTFWGRATRTVYGQTGYPPLIRCFTKCAPLQRIISVRDSVMGNGDGKKKLRIADYDVIGFDIDHTLTKYNVPHLFDTISDSFSEYLVERKGYDESIRRPFELDKDFCCRGIVLDLDHGNFLKLAEDGTVLRASHGTMFLTQEEIVAEYGSTRHWPQFEQMIDEVNNLGDRYRVFENFFDMPFMVTSARMVDLLDKQNGGRQAKYTFWQDVIEAAGYTYTESQFAARKGGFFPKIRDNPTDFLRPSPSNLIPWIKTLRQQNKKTFVLTSSFNDFAAFSLQQVFGTDWQQYFDIVCTFAKKPGFFTKGRPFLSLEDGKEKDEVLDLESGRMYSRGNPDVLEKYFRKVTGKDSPKVLFIGDSMRSDIFPSKKHGHWDTLLILEEMVLEQHTRLSTQDGSSSQPRMKKLKIEEPPQREREYLTSAHWGSFFTDHHPLQAENVVSAAGLRHMNTLWGYLVRKYADVAVPQLEYVADFPLDHEFEVFEHTDPFKWGFYPFLPSALLTGAPKNNTEDKAAS